MEVGGQLVAWGPWETHLPLPPEHAQFGGVSCLLSCVSRVLSPGRQTW